MILIIIFNILFSLAVFLITGTGLALYGIKTRTMKKPIEEVSS